MSELHQHYRDLLGLNSHWNVESVDLNLNGKEVVIRLRHGGGQLCCPQCKEECPRADTAPERSWRHLDTMQFSTEIRAAIPRSKCIECGVKTVEVPWAGKHSRFTLMFEAMAIEVFKAAANVSAASKLLGLNWESAHKIMERAVERGLLRRELDDIKHAGMDEKSFGKGQDYVSILSDLDGRRVLEVVPERTKKAANQLWKTLTKEQLKRIVAVSMDMWPAFMKSVQENLPRASIVHDRFHVSKYLNEAVDKVRRQENKALVAEGNDRLKGTRQLWLYNEYNLDEDNQVRLQIAQHRDLKTGRAWAIKENFRDFWGYVSRSGAKGYFDRWYAWAIRSRLNLVKKVAKMLKKHLKGLLTYSKHPITNAISEGFNSRIQSIKSSARGFRNFSNYRTRILFYCGKLDLIPELSH